MRRMKFFLVAAIIIAAGILAYVKLFDTEDTIKTRVIYENSVQEPERKRDNPEAIEIKMVTNPEKKEKESFTPSEVQKVGMSTVSKKNSSGPVVFLGDSLTEGLSVYGYYPEAVIEGINSLNTLSAQEHVYKIASLHPSKLFIQLGINDIWEGDPVNDFIDRYRNLIQQFEAQTPETDIYIESMLPVSIAAMERNPYINNDIINSANVAMREMAQVLKANYIDVNTALKDEDGNLRCEYSNDGVHLIDYYYPVWTEQLDPYAKS